MTVLPLTVALVLGGAAVASADVRYASVTGDDNDLSCPQSDPCDLATAIKGTTGDYPSPGDEIVVEPGTYDVGSNEISDTAIPDLYVHGEDGGAMPVIEASGLPAIFANDMSLSDLEITDNGTALSIASGDLSRLLLVGEPPADSDVCQCYNGTLSDSLVIASSGSGVGVNSNGGTTTEDLYNDTIIDSSKANSDNAPIELYDFGSGGDHELTASGVVAENTATGGSSIVAVATGTSTVAITLSRSAYDETSMITSGSHASITDGGENEFAAPIFAGGLLDFSEAWDSPTLGVGAPLGAPDPAVGTLDLAGRARTVDGMTDMGAFQYQAPVASAHASATTVAPGSPVTFSGSATDINSGHGTLSYSWTFDDGGSASGPSVAHAFATTGVHTATLTVSDGSPYTGTAQASVTVAAATGQSSQTMPSAPSLTAVSLALRQPRIRHGKQHKRPFSAKLAFSLNETANVEGTLVEKLEGKRVKGRCRAARTAARHARGQKCPTQKTIQSFTLNGSTGANSFSLPHASKLSKGRYVVKLTANAGTLSSSPVTVSFKVN
jgi:PKD domain